MDNSLRSILDGFNTENIEIAQNEAPSTVIPEGFCTECFHQIASLFCVNCQDAYCELCFQQQHRKGNRSKHKTQIIELKLEIEPDRLRLSSEILAESAGLANESELIDQQWFLERSKYIPLRLQMKERKVLRLLEATATINDYTDKVDHLGFVKKTQRVVAQLQEICSVLSALLVSVDYSEGQKLVKERDFKEHEKFFKDAFEIARRHKIMNPEKMRGEYGKIIYMLMDSQTPEVRSMLDFTCVKSIVTVHSYLEQRRALALLSDQLISTATREIIAGKRHRSEIQRDIKEKEHAIKVLGKRYANQQISREEVEQCLYSIGDNHCYLRENRDPIDKMIELLKTYFKPDEFENGFSLAIEEGQDGSRLSHNHTRQYYYVLQSLTLWREVMHEMFKLWYLAEEDLLADSNRYNLKDTGQGVNRVQASPRVSRAISTILLKAQNKVKVENWIGSSVIHLGDTNVPNALMFIDKYTQIPRILNPIVLTLNQVDDLEDNEELSNYFKARFNSVDSMKKEILCDFFKHAFDGSGGDNFFDAGSCIDGRLTSAWNWCSNLPSKRFYTIFKLTGFSGFDGSFNA